VSATLQNHAFWAPTDGQLQVSLSDRASVLVRTSGCLAKDSTFQQPPTPFFLFVCTNFDPFFPAPGRLATTVHGKTQNFSYFPLGLLVTTSSTVFRLHASGNILGWYGDTQSSACLPLLCVFRTSTLPSKHTSAHVKRIICSRPPSTYALPLRTLIH
jgi:hypothetical protein